MEIIVNNVIYKIVDIESIKKIEEITNDPCKSILLKEC